MGKFGIGARVRDDGGDEGVIVDKVKGRRLVKYDYAAYGKLWNNKNGLTALPANDNISPEIGENAYVGSGAWVPKVGDRVRFTEQYGGAQVGDEGEVTLLLDDDLIRVAANDTVYTAYSRRFEHVVAPATTAWEPKVGDRVNWTRVRGEFDGSTVEDHEGIIWDFVLRAPNGNHTYAFASELEPAPLTIEAGKFYRTRDGRKVGPMVNPRPGEFVGDWVWTTRGDVEGADSWSKAWRADGTFDPFNNDSVLDLVAEWVEPAEVAVAEATATPAPKFKLGDRVQVVATGSKPSRHLGDEFTINSDEGTYHWDGGEQCWAGEGSPYRWKESELSLAESAAPTAKFKVGDRVRYVDGGKHWQDVTITKIDDIGPWPIEGRCPVLGAGAFSERQLELAPTIPVGAQVTFTATGRLSAYTTDGHAQVVFPGLTPGQNSFALPAAFVSLAN